MAMHRVGKRRQETEGKITYKVGTRSRRECPFCHRMVWEVTISVNKHGLPEVQKQQADGKEHVCRQMRHSNGGA